MMVGLVGVVGRLGRELAVPVAAGDTGAGVAGAFQTQIAAARGHRGNRRTASSPVVAAAVAGIAGGHLEELDQREGREDVGWRRLDDPRASHRPMFQVLAENHM